MSSGDPHAPDMKKIKREDKDGHVIIKRNIFYFIYLFKRKKRVESTHMHARYTVNGHLGYNIFSSLFYFFFSPNLLQMSDGERSDQDLVVDDGGDVRDI
jgi:hypothetical protein